MDIWRVPPAKVAVYPNPVAVGKKLFFPKPLDPGSMFEMIAPSGKVVYKGLSEPNGAIIIPDVAQSVYWIKVQAKNTYSIEKICVIN
jgi:hypothetical protein